MQSSCWKSVHIRSIEICLNFSKFVNERPLFQSGCDLILDFLNIDEFSSLEQWEIANGRTNFRGRDITENNSGWRQL